MHTRSRLGRLFGATLLAIFSLVSAPAQAQPAAAAEAPVPLAHFFKRSAYLEMVSSPSGRYLATTSSMFGRLNLVVIDLVARKPAVLTR